MESKKRNRLEYLDLAKIANPDQGQQKVISRFDEPINLVENHKNSNPENQSCCEKYTAQFGRSNIEMLKSFIFNFSSIQLVMEKSIEDFGEKLVKNIFPNTEEEEMEANRQRQVKLEKEVEEFFRFNDSSPSRKRQKISDTSVSVITNTKSVKGKTLLKNVNTIPKETNPVDPPIVKTEPVKTVTDHTFNDWKIPASIPLPAQAERRRPLKPPPALIPGPWLRRTSGLWLESVHERRSAVKDMAIASADSSTRGPPPLKREDVRGTSMTWDDDTSPSTSTGITDPPPPGFHWRTKGPTISWDESIGAPPPLSAGNTKPPVNHPAEIWGDMKTTPPNLWGDPLASSTTTKPETASKATSTSFWDDPELGPSSDFLTSDLFDVFYTHPGTALVATRFASSRRIGRWGDALDLTTSIAEEDYPHIDTPDSPPPLEEIPTFVNMGPSTSDGRYIPEYQFFRPYEGGNSDDSD